MLVRPAFFEHPEDKELAIAKYLEDVYMIGDAVMQHSTYLPNVIREDMYFP